MSKKKDILDHITAKEKHSPSEDFFHTLATEAIKRQKKGRIIQRSFRKSLIYYGSAVAAIFLFGLFIFKDPNIHETIVKKTTSNLSQLSEIEIIEYVSCNLDDYYTDEIIELASVVLENEVDLISEENFLPPNIQITDIEHYIDDEEIDFYEETDLYEFDENELLIF